MIPPRPRLFALLLPLALALPGAARAAGEAPKDLVKASLVPEASVVDPGEPFWVALNLQMKPGWHVYWRNPGDSGLPVQLSWRLASDFSVTEPLWPAPSRFLEGPVANFGHKGEATLLVAVTPPAGLSVGDDVPIALKASWLVCEEECIPGEAELEASVRVGEQAVRSEGARPLFERARAALPKEAPFEVSLEHRLNGVPAALLLHAKDPALARDQVRGAHFFPYEAQLLEHAAVQPLRRAAEGLTLTLPMSALTREAPSRVAGVLVLEEDLEGIFSRQAFEVDARLPQAVARVPEQPPALEAPLYGGSAPAPLTSQKLGLLEVLLFALLGGLILNLMPCVFPVLSLKVLGVVQQAGEDARRIQLHGLAYTSGVMLSFAALAGALLLLRAGGAEIGWGFQLQSPWFVALLAYVMLAMALSLSGLFELGHSVMGLGSGLAAKKGLSGSFFTGVLATIVATPCTAPFMGAAVGFALSQPWALALGVFLALGFGLALPFLALSFAPALMKRLPRPGPWMVTLKEALAFPLYGTVAWLVWVLEQQAGPLGLGATLGGLVLVGFAAWAYGRSRATSGASRLLGTVASLVGGVSAVALLYATGFGPPPADFSTKTEAEAVHSASRGKARAEPGAGGFEPYSPERLDALLREGKPVFINLTAAWCVTCLVNEKNALSTDRVKAALASEGITYLKGDWTNEDPKITRLLERFGRSGVPLYLYYAAGKREPVVLPQILTESIVLEHLEAS